jgi:hypothetical protein
MYEHHSSPLISGTAFFRRMASHFAWVMLLVVGSLVGGMAGYMHYARMRAVDAFLNAAMLLGGMGPVGDLPNDAAKIFSGCFALYAGIIFIVSAGLLVAPVAHRILHRLHLSK